jgi:hypothetical protein
MGNDFRSQIGGYRANSMQNAMQMMGGGNSFNSVVSGSIANGAQRRQEAIDKANAWTSQGTAAMSSMGDSMNALAGNAMQQGMSMAANAAAQNEQMKAAKAARKSSAISSGISTAIGAVSTFAPLLLLCERRLKEDIAPIPEAAAWGLVRDLPLYSFHYKGNPGPTAYGPMIDEVEPLDPSLIRVTSLPPDKEGPIRGFDTARHQAYESIALQQALQRIEQLEHRLNSLERTTVDILPGLKAGDSQSKQA